ncbi:MAG: hypothetical protein FWE92_06390 [Defluviitaleaceae bacterium]|nr:hypothetical protein [Defluviitaleaceae bacterium]
MVRAFALVSILLIIAALAVYQAFTDEPESPPISLTGHRISHILADFAGYHEAIFSDAEIEIIEARANQVMGAFRSPFTRDFLLALNDEYRFGGNGIDYLLILIGSRVAEARAADDDLYEEALARWEREAAWIAERDSRLYTAWMDEAVVHMLSLIHANIEYFENR